MRSLRVILPTHLVLPVTRHFNLLDGVPTHGISRVELPNGLTDLTVEFEPGQFHLSCEVLNEIWDVTGSANTAVEVIWSSGDPPLRMPLQDALTGAMQRESRRLKP